MKKRRIAVYSVIALLLFFFFVPLYRTTVYFDLILPYANECGPVVTPYTPTIYASLSYITFGYLSTSQGVFGLIYVPGNSWNSIQFPPIGYTGVSCG